MISRGLGLLLLAAGLFQARPVDAATMEIAYSTLERMIVERVMTENGRHYLEGDPSNTCLYSFIQEPRVDAGDGRLPMGRADAEKGEFIRANG